MSLLRLPAVMRLSGYSRSMIYSLIAQGLYPRPIKISERAVAWLSSEVEQMLSAIVSGQPEEQRRALVSQMHTTRTSQGVIRVHGSDGSGGEVI